MMLEARISAVLRWGVLLCAGVILSGLFFSWVLPDAHVHAQAQLETLRQPASPTEKPWAMGSWRNPFSWVSLGILGLIGLPWLRVAVALQVFLAGGDWRFAGIGFLVLFLMGLGLFLGHHLS